MHDLIAADRKGNDKMDAACQSAAGALPLAGLRAAPPPPRVRVLLVAPFAPNGGGMGRMMAYLAEQDLAAQDLGEQNGGGGYSFETVESRGRGSALSSAWPMLRAAWTIWRRARGPAPVLLHVNMAERGSVLRKGVLLYLGRALGVRTVLHLHAAEIVVFYEQLGPFLRARVRGVFQAADVCIVLGEAMAAWTQTRLGVAASRIAVLRNGVPAPATLPLRVQNAPATLLFLGNLQARKGLGDLLIALADPECAARPFELIVAGGGDAAPWRAQAEALGLGGRVIFTGWVERAEATALLARACALILPSHHEGLPLVLLEAASMGVACITTPVGAIGEVFADGETALLVPAGDTAALGGAIARLIDDAGLRGRIGRNARALYERSFSMAIFTRGLVGVYGRARG